MRIFLFVILLLCAVPAWGGDMVQGGHCFAYFYFMDGEPAKIGKAVPAHVQYWKDLQLEYQGGPFGDDSGGMIVFTARSHEEAESVVANDPFVIERVVGKSWLKEWVVHSSN